MRLSGFSVHSAPPIDRCEVSSLSDLVVLAGPNGVGKTQLINHILNAFRSPGHPNIVLSIEPTNDDERAFVKQHDESGPKTVSTGTRLLDQCLHDTPQLRAFAPPRLRVKSLLALTATAGDLHPMTDPVLPWRPEFLDALRMLARVSEGMAARGLPRPVLVGGGAVEFYTGSAVMTGDIDVTSPVQPELEEELQKLGFVRPSGPGKSTRGWIHPDLGLGFEVVGNSPMGGSFSPATLVMIAPTEDSPDMVILSVEDMIADRMGQYASGTARLMLGQARELYNLPIELDRDYLDRRIREESLGDYGIEDLEA